MLDVNHQSSSLFLAFWFSYLLQHVDIVDTSNKTITQKRCSFDWFWCK